MSITIGSVEIKGNEVDVVISASTYVESNPWILRDAVLNARTSSGHKSVEIELLNGKRVLVQSRAGTYHKVPVNNDDCILSLDKVYTVLQVSINATAVSTANLDSLATSYKSSVDYYAKRRILLNKINDSSISYSKKQSYATDLASLTGSNLTVTVPGISGTNWEFSESGGLNIAYWTNGPYADLKISVESKTLLAF